MSIAVLDPPELAPSRSQLDLDSGSIRVESAGLDWGGAQIQAYMTDMKVGSGPVDFRLPNRTITIPLGLGMDDAGQAAFDAARAALQNKVALFQREGGYLKRQTVQGIHVYADIVNATLELPDMWGESGGVEADVKLVLECLPDFYGDEVTLDALTATGLVGGVLKQDGVDAVIAGDHPGRMRIIVSETSGHTQQSLIWGVRCRHYDPAATAARAYEAEALTPLDAASVISHSGASGGQTVKHPNLSGGAWVAVLSTTIAGAGDMTHRGSYRIWARVYTPDGFSPSLRLLYGIGDITHPRINNPVEADVGDFYLVDLGTIRLDPSPLSGYSWQGIIQAMGQTNGQTVEIDQLIFQPLDESAGWATIGDQTGASFGAEAGENRAFSIVDNSSYGTLAWTHPEFASVDDGYTAAAVLLAAQESSHYLLATQYGFDIPSSATITGIQVDIKRSCPGGLVGDDRLRLVKGGAIQATDRARFATWPTPWPDYQSYGGPDDLWGGTWTPTDINASGFGAALAAKNYAASPGPTDTAQVDALLIIVYYSTGSGFTQTQDAVMFASRQAELRTEGCFRQNAAGTIFGEIPVNGGDLPRIPPSGLEGRKVELMLRATRLPTTDPGNFTYFEDPALDSLSVQVKYRASYLGRP